MKKNKDKRLLSALDHIDDRFVERAGEKIKERPMGVPTGGVSKMKIVKQIAWLVASLLLLAAVIPLVTVLINNISDITGPAGSEGVSSTPESYDDELTEEPDEITKSQYDKIVILSNGLKLELSRDGEYYIVDNGRECTDPTIVIPDTYNDLPIAMIAEGAFSGNKAIKSLTISKNVIWIDQNVFSGCEALEYNEHGNAKYLGSADNPYAFLISSAGEDIESVDIHKSTRAIAGRAFMDNTKLTEVKIPDSVIAIAKMAFESCTSLSELDLGEGIKYIGEQAFSGCSALKEIVLPASTISLENYAFLGCSSVTKLELNEGLEEIGYEAFGGLAIESVVIPDSVKTLGTFEGCSNLKKIVIGDGVTSIDGGTFRYCRALTEVEFGNSVKRIEWLAFETCTSLEKVILPEGLDYLDPKAFARCDKLQYNIYKGARYLGSEQNEYEYLVGFESTDMTSLEFHPRMRRLMTQGLSSLANLTEISIKDGMYLYVEDNCLIDRDSKTLIAGLNNSVIPNDGSVTAIGDYAFYKCKEFKIIYFPTKLVSIGDYAFSECDSLTTLKFFESFESIGYKAFEYCDSIREVLLPSSLKKIGTSAFSYCPQLSEIVIPDNVTELGEEAFRGCFNLKFATVGNGITELPERVFQNCSRLERVILPRNLKVIGERAFAACESLPSIVIPEGLLYINDKAFQRCESLIEVHLPFSLLGVGYQAFEECSLITVWIEGGLREMGEDVFGNNGDNVTIKYDGTAEMWKKIDNYDKIVKSRGSATVQCSVGELRFPADN